MHRSGAHEWMHRLQPALEAALGKIMMLPERKLDSITAFRLRFLEVKRVMIDGTERKVCRDEGFEGASFASNSTSARHQE